MSALDNSLVEPFDENGWWWLPHAPDDRIPGRLILDSSSLSLRLQGSFVGIKDLINRGAESEGYQYPTVLGVLESGQACTLSDSMQGKIKEGRSKIKGAYFDYIMSEIFPTIVFIGAHLETLEEQTFRRVSARLANLEDWMAHTGVQKTSKRNKETGCSDYSFEYSRPSSLKFEIDFGKICFESVYTTPTLPSYEIHLSERLVVSIDFSSPTEIFEALRTGLDPLRNFLALAVGRPIRILHLEVDPITSSTSRPLEDIEKESKRNVTVIYNDGKETGIEEENLLEPFMLLPFTLIRDRFGDYLNAWYQLHKEIDDVLQNFFEAVYHSDALSLHHAFLTLVGALEAYHERRVNSSKQVILNIRLKFLCKPIFELLDANKSMEEEILKRTVATRHYYSHFSKKRREQTLKPRQIIYVSRLLEWAFRYALLGEMGHDDEFCRKQIAESRAFLRFKTYQWPQLACIVDEN